MSLEHTNIYHSMRLATQISPLNNYCITGLTLVGGTRDGKSGNVFARHPVTGFYGPVCDDYFDMAEVSLLHFSRSYICTIN